MRIQINVQWEESFTEEEVEKLQDMDWKNEFADIIRGDFGYFKEDEKDFVIVINEI